jgi:ketosteroid isomerase-like protein
MKDWIKQLFIAIDRKDAQGFAAFFTDNAIFRFANAPAVAGKENIRQAVEAFFSAVKGLRHNITGAWELKDVVICEGEVTYTRLDDKQLTVPFVDIFRIEKGLIADYRIYIDISALFA